MENPGLDKEIEFSAEKCEIFEGGQQKNMINSPDHQHAFAMGTLLLLLPEPAANGPCDGNGNKHQEYEHRLSPRIEKDTGHQKKDVFCPPALSNGREIIDPQHNGKKEKEKNRGCENHNNLCKTK